MRTRARWTADRPTPWMGMRALVAEGVEMVEIDVRRSGDGILIAHHDERLPDRRLVSDVSAHDIAAAYSRAARPARLEELVAATTRGMRLQLDLKADGVEEDALALALEAVPAPNVFVTTPSARQVDRVKTLRPEVRVGLSLNRSPGSFLRGLSRARRSGADLLAIHHAYLRTPLPARARTAELALFGWTVNDDAQLARLVREPHIGCAITDRPLRALESRSADGSASAVARPASTPPS